MSTVPVADQQTREPPRPAGFTGTKGALMCAQPHDPEQANDNRADVPAPVEQNQQESPGSAPSRQPRRRGSAGRTGRNLVVRGVRRDPPDIRKLARVVASLAAAMSEPESDGQPLPAEQDTAGTSPRRHRSDAA
ncbi:hypothetical protein GCM10027521_02730 [Amycolatopsis cihanbeyliensis]